MMLSIWQNQDFLITRCNTATALSVYFIHFSLQTSLSLTSYLAKETDYIPWSAALSGLSYINKMLKRTPAYGDFKRSLNVLGEIIAKFPEILYYV